MRHALSSPTRRAFYFGVALLFTLCAAASSPAAAQEDGTQQEALPLDPELPYCASGDGGPRRSPARAMLCSLVVTASTAIVLNALGEALAFFIFPFGDPPEWSYWRGWDVMLAGGALTVAGGALLNLVAAPIAAQGGRRDGHEAQASLSVRPRLDPAGEQAGLTVTVGL